MFDLGLCQKTMTEKGIDVWVAYDFRGSNPVFWHLLGEARSTTRRAFLVIPCSGRLKLFVHGVDRDAFQPFSVEKTYFHNWTEMHALLREVLVGAKHVAMEYSPNGDIPTASWVDAGTVELMRGWGFEILSSADLFQVAAASWDDYALQSHLKVCPVVAQIKDEAFALIAARLREDKHVTEYDVRNFIMNRFEEEKLETEDAPIVAVNANSGDPHYEPAESASATVRTGDWVLIDLWARYPGERNVFSDITWVAYAGAVVPQVNRRVFEIVRAARDLAIDFLKQAWKENRSITGYEVDAVVREKISQAGFGNAFIHRTGHSIAPGTKLHGLGVQHRRF